MSVLQADIRSVSLSGQRILHGMDVRLSKGTWTAVVGPNGAGKSTLLCTLAGLQPFEGGVQWQGQAWHELSAKERARTVSWLGQAEGGADDLRASDVVMLGRLPHQSWLAAPSEADHAAVEQAMQQTQCWSWRHRLMGQLSGGERQRVLLARALCVQAPILMMDEPLAHLDPPHQADWLDIVRGLRQGGTTIVSVLHELNMALHADELIIMNQGRIVHQGAADDAVTQAALVQVFDQRVQLHKVAGQWVALPCAAPHSKGDQRV